MFVIGIQDEKSPYILQLMAHRSNAKFTKRQKAVIEKKVNPAEIMAYFERPRWDWNRSPRPAAIEWLAATSLQIADKGKTIKTHKFHILVIIDFLYSSF